MHRCTALHSEARQGAHGAHRPAWPAWPQGAAEWPTFRARGLGCVVSSQQCSTGCLACPPRGLRFISERDSRILFTLLVSYSVSPHLHCRRWSPKLLLPLHCTALNAPPPPPSPHFPCRKMCLAVPFNCFFLSDLDMPVTCTTIANNF